MVKREPLAKFLCKRILFFYRLSAHSMYKGWCHLVHTIGSALAVTPAAAAQAKEFRTAWELSHLSFISVWSTAPEYRLFCINLVLIPNVVVELSCFRSNLLQFLLSLEEVTPCVYILSCKKCYIYDTLALPSSTVWPSAKRRFSKARAQVIFYMFRRWINWPKFVLICCK